MASNWTVYRIPIYGEGVKASCCGSTCDYNSLSFYTALSLPTGNICLSIWSLFFECSLKNAEACHHLTKGTQGYFLLRFIPERVQWFMRVSSYRRLQTSRNTAQKFTMKEEASSWIVIKTSHIVDTFLGVLNAYLYACSRISFAHNNHLIARVQVCCNATICAQNSRLYAQPLCPFRSP
jgi:hypothetical protein